MSPPSCGKSAAGFDQWKADFAQEAQAAGVGNRGLSALAGATYATGTIKADRAIHKAFSGSVDALMKRRGAATIISRGKSLKKANASLFNKIESRYGVSIEVAIDESFEGARMSVESSGPRPVQRRPFGGASLLGTRHCQPWTCVRRH